MMLKFMSAQHSLSAIRWFTDPVGTGKGLTVGTWWIKLAFRPPLRSETMYLRQYPKALTAKIASGANGKSGFRVGDRI